MPGIDGWAVLAQLKADPELADIPVIIISIVEEKNLGYSLGASDYLTKPVDKEQLSRILSDYQYNQTPILIVDDEEDARDMLRRTLAKLGKQVVEASNGRIALERIEESEPSLVLLDLMMPEMNGFEFLDELKRRYPEHTIPVVVLTGKSLTSDERKFLRGQVEDVMEKSTFSREKLLVYLQEKLGAQDYLGKPFNPVLLRARVDACLEKKRLRDQEQRYLKQIEDEKKRADDLLEVILPRSIAEELKRTNEVQPKRYENAVVLFADIVGFTEYCDQRAPDEVLNKLQEMVYAFEGLVSEHGLLKLKTIGDSFMASAGLLNDVTSPSTDPVADSVRCGLAMISSLDSLNLGWNLRVGIHTGPLVAGVVGHRQYLFDVWGDTVNTAARIEEHGAPGAVNLSRQAWDKVSPHFDCVSTQTVSVKGKGEIEIFQVSPQLSSS